ncbi:hypothetical protein GQ457_17G009360 [Hibiscus cannabinus]
MKIQGKSKKEIPKNVAVDLSLLSLPRCSKSLAWSSTMVGSGGVPCEQQNILAALSFLHFVCSALQYAVASRLPGKSSHMQGQLAQKSTSSLPSQSLQLLHLHNTTNSTFLKQHQPFTSNKVGKQHPCNNANYMLLLYMKWAWNK